MKIGLFVGDVLNIHNEWFNVLENQYRYTTVDREYIYKEDIKKVMYITEEGGEYKGITQCESLEKAKEIVKEIENKRTIQQFLNIIRNDKEYFNTLRANISEFIYANIINTQRKINSIKKRAINIQELHKSCNEGATEFLNTLILKVGERDE